jgi:hypothetical protein
MGESRMPRVDAYLAGNGDLEAAAAELISCMPVHGTLLGSDQSHSADVEGRAQLLRARTRTLLAELRQAGSDGTA